MAGERADRARRIAASLAEDLKKSFVAIPSYIDHETRSIGSHVRWRFSEMNCKRILTVSPVMALFGIIYMAWNAAAKPTGHTAALIAVTAALVALSAAYAALILWYIYVKKGSLEEKSKGYEVIYHTFWALWLIGAVALISFHYQAGRSGGGLYVFVCVMIILVPLYSKRDFIAFVIVLVALFAAAVWRGMYDVEFLIYNIIAMTLMGFFAQYLEWRLWTMQEYVYLTAFIDPLTGCLNRRGGDALLDQELSKRGGSAEIGVIMMDIDFFKKYNDTLGHDAGDDCLRRVSRCVRDAVEDRTRLVIRHGGEEFVVLLMDASEDELRCWAERVREAVFSLGLPAPFPKVADVVTISVGASLAKGASEAKYERYVKGADEALYEAKESGRNRVAYR